MLPHAGEDSAKWREIVQLRAALDAVSEVVGSTVKADIAMLFDWESWWALEHGGKPSDFLRWNTVLRPWYDELWRANMTVDFVHPDADLSAYKAVLVPTLYMIRPQAAENLERYVAAGGHALVSYWSGIVDETDTVYLGGYPGALRNLLGVRIEEIHPLCKGSTEALSDGTTCVDWNELGQATTAEVLATYTSGSVAGSPAITRNKVGTGSAWYMGAHLQPDGMRSLLKRFLAESDCTSSLEDGLEVEQVRRSSSEGSWLFAINHSAEPRTIQASGLDLITGQRCAGSFTIDAGSVAVIRE
jgi:beta-galactosidase